MNTLRALVPALTLAVAAAVPAHAGITVTFAEVGSDVVATVGGSTGLGGLIPSGSFNDNLGDRFIRPDSGIVLLGTGSNRDMYSLPTQIDRGYGPGGGDPVPSSSVGDFLLFSPINRLLGLPAGYQTGQTLQSTSTFANASFASLGIGFGTTVYDWGTGSLTVTAVPEPSTAVLAVGGLLALAGAMRRRAQARTEADASGADR